MSDKEKIDTDWFGWWGCVFWFFFFGPSSAHKEDLVMLAGVRFRKKERQWYIVGSIYRCRQSCNRMLQMLKVYLGPTEDLRISWKRNPSGNTKRKNVPRSFKTTNYWRRGEHSGELIPPLPYKSGNLKLGTVQRRNVKEGFL